MTFTSGIPFDGQSLGASKPLVRDNFTNYATLVSVDHVTPNASGQGKHNKSTYVAQGSSPATSSGEADIYSKSVTYTSGTQIELFCQKQSQLSGAADVKLTRFDFGVLAAAKGYTFLPGGLIFMWADFPSASNGTTLTWASVGLPSFPSNCFQVFLTIRKGSPPPNGNLIVQDGTISTSQFTVLSTISGGVPVQVLAIGN